MFCNIKNKTDTLKECAPVTFFLWRKGGGEGGRRAGGGRGENFILIQFVVLHSLRDSTLNLLRGIIFLVTIFTNNTHKHNAVAKELFCKKSCSEKFRKIHKERPVSEYLFK